MYQQQAPKREPTARERLAKINLRKEQEFQQEQQLKAQAAQEAAQERAKQEQEAQRTQLEALRQQRIERETFESMTPEEVQVYQQQNAPAKVIGDLAAKARQQEEEEFAARIMREYEQELRESGATYGTRSTIRSTAEQHRVDKANEFIKAREMRELQAEAQGDPLRRTVYSLGDRARELLAEMTKNQPGAMERAQAAKQTVQANKAAGLKAQYLQELQQNFRNGFIPSHIMHQIRDKYIEAGLNVYSPDIAEDVLKLRRTVQGA
jgi:hypothetical protein